MKDVISVDSNSKSEEHRCEECNSVCQNCNTAPEPPQDTSLDLRQQIIDKLLSDDNAVIDKTTLQAMLDLFKQQQIKLIERIEGEVNSEYELSIADLELRQHQQGVEIPVLGKTELLETLKQIKERL